MPLPYSFIKIIRFLLVLSFDNKKAFFWKIFFKEQIDTKAIIKNYIIIKKHIKWLKVQEYNPLNYITFYLQKLQGESLFLCQLYIFEEVKCQLIGSGFLIDNISGNSTGLRRKMPVTARKQSSNEVCSNTRNYRTREFKREERAEK